MNPFDLQGKVVLVTGGSSGIGLGMATALRAAGASVCIWGRSAERNAAALAALPDGPSTVASREVDVTDEESVVAGMAALVKDFGRLDACFANACGHGARSPSFIESTASEWHSAISEILGSVYTTTREAAKVLVAQGEGGSLVATSSIAAHYGAVRGNHAYASGKAAVTTLLRGLAVELARHQIRANSIVPGWVDGPFMDGVRANPKLAERALQRLPFRRFADPSELGALAVYLAGDGSTWHTGDEFVIDGGYHAV